MALGKPVICYLRESWIKNFNKYFPEINSLPIVKANLLNIKDTEKLIEDDELRNKVSKDTREFMKIFLT